MSEHFPRLNAGTVSSYSAIDVGKLHTERPEDNTGTLSLGARPPRPFGLLREAFIWFESRSRFVLFSLPWVTIKHLAVYTFLLSVPAFAVSQWTSWTRSSTWHEYTALVAQYLPLSQIAELLSHPETLLAMAFATFVWFYALNYIDLFWELHFGARDRPGFLVVPTWVKYQPQTNTASRIAYFDASNLHFGLLGVWYGFTKEAFFIREQADHLVTVIDYSIILDVDVYPGAEGGWWGNDDTPPVRITIDSPGDGNTILMIHGAYFEAKRNGRARAEEFVRGLKAAKAAKLSKQAGSLQKKDAT